MALREPAYYEARARAYSAIWKLRRAGLLSPEPCATCGEVRWPEAHHRWGYEGDNALRIVWLCGRCHGDEHQAMRAAKRAENFRAMRQLREAETAA